MKREMQRSHQNVAISFNAPMVFSQALSKSNHRVNNITKTLIKDRDCRNFATNNKIALWTACRYQFLLYFLHLCPANAKFTCVTFHQNIHFAPYIFLCIIPWPYQITSMPERHNIFCVFNKKSFRQLSPDSIFFIILVIICH